MALSSGDKLGPYEIVAPLGAGGMGEVYKARDTRLQRMVAVKVSKEDFSSRFEREARAIAALNHPHICALYDVGPNFLVMELVEGTRLAGPLPVEKAVEYGTQILDALHAAHRCGFTHRDLKPANILVTGRGIKLLDFGLAKQNTAITPSDSTLTEEGQIVGTLHYMSPEQLQGRPADARSDLFAFGCVLYEMLSGKQAFAGESSASVIASILEREPAPLRAERPDVPAAIESLIALCLAKDPEGRIQCARDLAFILRERSRVPAVVESAAYRGGMRRWVWAAMALVAGLAGVAGWVAKPPAEAVPLVLSIDPPPGEQRISEVAISPDGSKVILGTGVNSPLYLRSLESGSVRALAGTAGAEAPFWSPDSRWVAYFTPSKLMRIDTTGGVAEVICAASGGKSGSWSAEGTIIFSSIQGGLVVSRVAASGGTPVALTSFDKSRSEWAHDIVSFLPDRRRFVYRARGNEDMLRVRSLSDDPATPGRDFLRANAAMFASLPRRFGGSEIVLFEREGQLHAQRYDVQDLALQGEATRLSSRERISSWSISSEGTLVFTENATAQRLVWRSKTGELMGVIEQNLNGYTSPAISPDGQRVAYNASRSRPVNWDLWISEPDRAESRRFTFEPAADHFPVWSADGREIVYSSQTPVSNLYRRRVSAAAPTERLTDSQNFQYMSDWSRDGRFALFTQVAEKTSTDIMILPMVGARKPAAWLATNAAEGQARFSPDGQWVAYASDETGSLEVYVQPFVAGRPAEGAKYQISSGGGAEPKWRRDGKRLYYRSRDGRICEAAIETSSGSLSVGQRTEILNEVRTGSRSGVLAGQYDVAPDGSRFAIVEPKPEPGPASASILLNWPALLPRR